MNLHRPSRPPRRTSKSAGPTSAVIVAAGKGTRMGPNVDKLFLQLAGCPVIVHTWRRFDEAKCVDEIVLVVREGMQPAFEELALQLSHAREAEQKDAA